MEKIKILDLKINHWLFKLKPKELLEYSKLWYQLKYLILLKYSQRTAKLVNFRIVSFIDVSSLTDFSGLIFRHSKNDWKNKYFRNCGKNINSWWKSKLNWWEWRIN